MDLPPLLYKYCPADRLSMLGQRLVRYSQLSAFNDPFEGRPSMSALAPEEVSRETYREMMPKEMDKLYAALSPEVRASMPYEEYVRFFRTFAEQKESEVLTAIQAALPAVRTLFARTLDSMIGVLSLSEVPDSLLMWSHYGSSHAGFVLGFNARHSYFNQRKGENDEFRHLRRVVYRDARPRAPMTLLDGVDVFLVKSVQWAYEREWRILRPLSDADSVIKATPYPICLLRYPSDALAEVILGARATEELKASILDVVRSDKSFAHVRVKQASASDEHFLLGITDVAT